METTMIDSNLLFWLEVCALTVLVGVGIWRIYRTGQPANINVPDSVAYDMRQDGQRLSVQPNRVVEPISAI
jgi:ABC-type nickel/cobalt efflux system permease component RcnA